jgi:hypothetical protein
MGFTSVPTLAADTSRKIMYLLLFYTFYFLADNFQSTALKTVAWDAVMIKEDVLAAHGPTTGQYKQDAQRLLLNGKATSSWFAFF